MVLVFVSGIVDNLDRAVAVMSGRTTRWGYVLDSVVDRIADVLTCWPCTSWVRPVGCVLRPAP